MEVSGKLINRSLQVYEKGAIGQAVACAPVTRLPWVQSKSVEEKERTLGAFPGNTRQTRAIWRTASTEKMASRSQGSFCSGIHCQNSRKKCPQMSCFRFPKDAER